MKTLKYLSMLLMMVALSVCNVSCGDDGDEESIEPVDKTTRCTVINKVSGVTLRDVNVIHVNSRNENIKTEYIGDIPNGQSRTFTCIGKSVYFRLNLSGTVCFTADFDLIQGESNTAIIDDNTFVYHN